MDRLDKRVRVQSVRVTLAWPSITMAIYVHDASIRNLIRNSIDQIGRVLRPIVFPGILFGGLCRIENWKTQAYYDNALRYPGVCRKRKAWWYGLLGAISDSEDLVCSPQLHVADFDVYSNRIRTRTAYLARDPIPIILGRALQTSSVRPKCQTY